MKKTFTLLFILMVTLNGYSQLSKTHYIPPITAATYMSSTTIDVDQYIYISTPSTNPVTVTITLLGATGANATVVNATVTNASPWVYMISAPLIPNPDPTLPPKPAKDGQNTQLFVPTYLLGTVLKDRGYLIEANDFIYANLRVLSRVSSGNSSQAGGLVAKGISAYGKEFRIGGMENRGVMGSGNSQALMNFASFVATEDNTTVTITLPKVPLGTFMFPKTLFSYYPYGYPFPNSDFYYPPVGAPAPTSYTSPTSNNYIYNGPITVTLNKNESYVIAMENSSDATFESNYMLGGLITSDRNIVVNCGSIAGNSQIKGEVIPGNVTPYNNAGKDFGFDQIVGSDKTGKEFIFVGGYGITAKYYDLERAIIIANVNNTKVFKDGLTLVATLNAGEYYVFNGSDYTNGNLYVTTSENVFAYQCIAGKPTSPSNAAGNQNMFFVPPLNCTTPSTVNNIPLIDEIGLATSTNGLVKFPETVVNIVTQKFMADGVTDNKVFINGTELVSLMPGLSRADVTGKTDIPFVAYSYKTTGGNISVTSSAQVYVSFYGSSDNAAFGSYYSGFSNDLLTVLAGSSLTATQTGASYQWYKCPNTLLDGETSQSYTPTADGDYKVEITSLSGCSIASDCVTFSSLALGVKDNNTASKFVLYPNPTTGILNVESNIEDDFTVVNQLGQVVKTVKVNVGTNKVNLENLVDGVYFLKNKSGENQVVKKIIKN
ncbi:MAG TPA: T9SS type A sorting domain-containing protein [Flavobacterium sp.]